MFLRQSDPISRWFWLASLLVILVAGCGGPQPIEKSQLGGVAGSAPTEAALPTEEPADAGTLVGEPTMVPTPAVTQTVIARLAEMTGVTAEEITVMSMQATEFGSTALGCPEPDKMYSDMITPGFIMFANVGGEVMEIHTDSSGEIVVRCDSEVGGQSSPPPVSEQALALVTEKTGIASDQLKVVSVEEVEWPDASLGCPKPGMAYAQVITSGFKVIIESNNGERFAVHTNEVGSGVICEQQSGVQPVGEPEVGGAAVDTPQALSQEAQQPAQVAKQAAADALGVAADALELVSWQEMFWRDGSLGCPVPGQSYLQAITPGYLFVYRSGDQQIEVHTNKQNQAVPCVDGKPVGQ